MDVFAERLGWDFVSEKIIKIFHGEVMEEIRMIPQRLMAELMMCLNAYYRTFLEGTKLKERLRMVNFFVLPNYYWNDPREFAFKLPPADNELYKSMLCIRMTIGLFMIRSMRNGRRAFQKSIVRHLRYKEMAENPIILKKLIFILRNALDSHAIGMERMREMQDELGLTFGKLV
jgi:hypothetical protein